MFIRQSISYDNKMFAVIIVTLIITSSIRTNFCMLLHNVNVFHCCLTYYMLLT